MDVSTNNLYCYINKSVLINGTFSYYVKASSNFVSDSQTNTRSIIFGKVSQNTNSGTEIFPFENNFSKIISIIILLLSFLFLI